MNKRLTVYLSEDTYQRIRGLAVLHGQSLSTWMERAALAAIEARAAGEDGAVDMLTEGGLVPIPAVYRNPRGRGKKA